MNNRKLKPIMFVGTGSDVGKSVINAAFCRIFLQDGYAPAPFKAQNMSLNSYVTEDQLEIGRAQAVQAEACGIDCLVEMNPILLKPTNNISAQLVLNGKPVGNKTASEYFEKTDRDYLFKEATNAFDRLAQSYNPIVLEGAGSISEINLWDKDIVNMRMALHCDAATYLIADIDKGGVFASVYGSIQLLPQAERDAIKGIIINKFRGDINLFTEGRVMLEKLTGKPVIGVIPYFEDIFIEQEDAVIIDHKQRKATDQRIKIAVVLLRHMSNFTDFNTLEQLPDVQLYYTNRPEDIAKADIVIIPGSKNVILDLSILRKEGIAKAIQAHHRMGKPLYGICGGYQMMGEWIHDPLGIEGEIESLPGLGILPVTTTLANGKVTRQCEFTLLHADGGGKGYEIHAGETPTTRPFTQLSHGEQEGYYLNEHTWGSYIHGIFDNESVVNQILKQVDGKEYSVVDYQAQKDENYNRLAAWVRKHIDMEYVYKTMECN
jgi:adenosylcobyric acid synthase